MGVFRAGFGQGRLHHGGPRCPLVLVVRGRTGAEKYPLRNDNTPICTLVQIYSNSSVEFRLNILTHPLQPAYSHLHGPPACPRCHLWSQSPLGLACPLHGTNTLSTN